MTADRREDLLSLSDQDLEGYSNRGNVKRAHKELDKIDDLSTVLSIDEQRIIATWPDGVKTQLPHDAVFPEGDCTCPATTTCRHIVMLVLGYQRAFASTLENDEESVVWNPGEISDEKINEHMSAANLRRAKKWWEEGVLVELTFGEKPLAVIETLGLAVRFLVKGDLRYVQSDSDPNVTQSAAVVAIWAFRQLTADSEGGYVSTHTKTESSLIPPQNEIKEGFLQFLTEGCAHSSQQVSDRLTRIALSYEKAGWLWPSENINQVVNQIRRYHSHDGLFDPNQLVRHIGECLCRIRALSANTLPIPEVIIRGELTRKKEATGKSRFIGLGCVMHELPSGILANAYLQSADTGMTLVLEKFWPFAKAQDEEKTFADIAQVILLQGVSFSQLAKSQVLSASAKRTRDSHVVFGRNTSVNPQSYQWDNLRPPLLMENFATLEQRLSLRPPSTFRSMKASEDFYVLKVTDVAEAKFNNATQHVEAILLDEQENPISLRFPYNNKSHSGVDNLLVVLRSPDIFLKFVAGKVRDDRGIFVITPVSVVFEKGQNRYLLQPFVDNLTLGDESVFTANQSLELEKTLVNVVISDVLNFIAELVISGYSYACADTVLKWEKLIENVNQVGLHTLANLMQASKSVFEPAGSDDSHESLLKVMMYLRLGNS